MMSEYTASYFHKGAVTFWEHFGEKGELTDLNEPVCPLCLKRWEKVAKTKLPSYEINDCLNPCAKFI